VAFVYLLRCADGSLYCGWTVDVPRRIGAHAAGKASKYTAARLPVALAGAWEVPTHTDARRLEARVKQLTRGEKLALLRGAPLDGATPVRFASPAP
jgi:putative endonuclease